MMRRSVSLVVLPLLLLAAACQPADVGEEPRVVSVQGEGEIRVAPEIAIVRLAVQARDRELDAARAVAAEVVNRVLALTDELSIDRERVQSTQVHVQPEYDWHEGRQEFRGYLVQREIRVELEDMANLGPLVERAVRTGVNDVSRPELTVKDPRALHREALRRAAEDARANADVLARTLDATLGEIRRVEATGGREPPFRPELAVSRLAEPADAEQSYQAGMITVRARVQAAFELR